MGKIEINNFNVQDLEKAIKSVIQDAVVFAVKEQINPRKEEIKLLSREDTAKTLCVSLPTLHEWTKQGLIYAYRIGSRVLYKSEDILDALTMINSKPKRGGSSC